MSQSVSRALQLLRELGQAPAGLDELAAAIGVHKTTVLRLLRTLAEQQFVFHDADHRYHLGSRVFELSSRALDQRSVRSTAAPHLAAFNRAHGRTTHLAVLEGGEAIYIDKLESHDHIRMYSRIGLRAPLHSSAVGKVLLADLPAAELREIVSRIEYTPSMPNTITDAEGLLAELSAVRQQGWAHDREENEPSINCIAAPVRGAAGTTVAAVSVSVPAIVLDYDQLLGLLPELLDVTARISADCGWRGPTTRPTRGIPT